MVYQKFRKVLVTISYSQVKRRFLHWDIFRVDLTTMVYQKFRKVLVAISYSQVKRRFLHWKVSCVHITSTLYQDICKFPKAVLCCEVKGSFFKETRNINLHATLYQNFRTVSVSIPDRPVKNPALCEDTKSRMSDSKKGHKNYTSVSKCLLSKGSDAV